MTFVAILAFEALRLLLRIMVVVLVLHFVRGARGALRSGPGPSLPAHGDWPSVTVQLPMRNEFYVAERLIRAVVAFDYPRDKLSVQVLDDSDDETADIIRGLVATLRGEGHDVEILHRSEPAGYKAGALNAGLRTARGEFVAMFDADCLPASDFLKATIPHFADPTVACVQVRWEFLNRGRSLLTRIQALVLDGLFAVDQHARAASGLPLQFNGTNGVWRRAAIDAVGGWNPGTLAEDADLSFRAYLEGYRVIHLRDYAVPTEIPEDMPAFRAQQRRWALGTAQILRGLGPRIIRAKIPFRSKVLMFMHLGRHSIDPLILVACVTAPLTSFFGMDYLVNYGPEFNLGMVMLLVFACTLFYGVALRRVGRSAKGVVLVPAAIMLAVGLSLVYTAAFVRGLFQHGGAFVRTPKSGTAEREARGPRYRSPIDLLALAEIGIGGAHSLFTYWAISRGDISYGLVFAAAAGSFLWVGLGSLFGGLLRVRRTAALARVRSSAP